MTSALVAVDAGGGELLGDGERVEHCPGCRATPAWPVRGTPTSPTGCALAGVNRLNPVSCPVGLRGRWRTQPAKSPAGSDSTSAGRIVARPGPSRPVFTLGPRADSSPLWTSPRHLSRPGDGNSWSGKADLSHFVAPDRIPGRLREALGAEPELAEAFVNGSPGNAGTHDDDTVTVAAAVGL